MRRPSKFSHMLTSSEIVNWIKAGDISEAKNLGLHLAWFLHGIAENNEARLKLAEKGIWPLDAESLKFISERLLNDSLLARGKSTKSGLELFSKVLVPNKPTKPQSEARLLAWMADRNLKAQTKKEYKRVTLFINNWIDKNNKIFEDWKASKRDDMAEFHPACPKRKITHNQLEKAHRKYRSQIDKANGIHRIEK